MGLSKGNPFFDKKIAGSLKNRHFSFCLGVKLRRMNGFRRARIRTSTTICTSVRIDFINIAFRNCFNRTLADTRAASNTITTNHVCHNKIILKMMVQNYNIILFVKLSKAV
jgi:hypothetical protein